MIQRLWWVALAAGLACSSSGQGSAGADGDAARARAGAESAAPGSTTELDPELDPGPGANAAEELRLLETETGLVVQLERDGQLIERSCTGTCYDVCQGCLLEACRFSSEAALCNSAADVCENRCSACVSVNQQATCEAPSCAGDLSCYFVTLGVPEEFRNAVRGGSGEPGQPQPLSPEPGTSDPESAAAPAVPGAADPNAGQPNAAESSSGEGNGAGSY